MPRARPTELHVNSFGIKRGKMQEILHIEKKYVFYPLSSKEKTMLYNIGKMDGSKKTIQFYEGFEDVLSAVTKDILVVQRSHILTELNKDLTFNGKLSLEKTYLIHKKEAMRFLKEQCENCSFLGHERCWQQGYDCSIQDRDYYKELSAVFEKERSDYRHSRFAYPN